MPRSDGLVDSREAAALYGCHPHSLVTLMKVHGIRHAAESPSNTGGVKYWWRPADVLAARKISRVRRSERARRNIVHAHNRGAWLRGIETRKEQYRAKVLARIAARRAA